MAITWLHISDLHVRGGDSYDRSVVFSALVRSVRRFREKEDRAPDLVFATGDIAFSGRSEEYTIASEFFDQLLEAVGLERRRLYVIPGNHDVDRSIGLQLKRELESSVEADAYFDPENPHGMLHLTHKQASFLRWYEHYFDGIRKMPEKSTCGPVELVDLRGYRLGILPINTALFAQNDQDSKRLWVGRRCLDSTVVELNRLDADLKLALMHHPLEDLSDLERQNIRARLVDNFDVILAGHLHEAGYFGVDMITGRNLYCQAGATYQTRERPNRAYYASFDRNGVTIFPIRYEDQPREVWTLDTSLFPYDAGYMATFPVPRGPSFRSFRSPLWDGLYQVPGHKTASVRKQPVGGRQEVTLGRQIGALQAMEKNSEKQKSKSKKTKHKARQRRRRKT